MTSKVTHPLPALVAREQRIPLHVPVSVTPALPGCWSVNVSRSGLGLVAPVVEDAALPAEGEEIDVAFPLPDGEAIAARGLVCWRADPRPGERGPVSLGVRFVSFAEDGQLRLARYLYQHRQRATIAFCPPGQRLLLEAALASELELHFCESGAEVLQTLERGDVAALVICGHEEERAAALLEFVAERHGPAEHAGPGQPGDLAARVVYAAPAPPGRIVQLFNQGRIFRALEPSFGARELRDAVMAACAEHGVRTEQQRAGLALERALLRRTHPAVRGPATPATLVGFDSPAGRRALELAFVAAPHPVAVLLQGETGVGKEVLARLLHDQGPNRAGPFVAQDCGAMAESLLESELFGHVKGAFTGAWADHPGLFVLADSGTIFLDEIENTTAHFQTRLLRVLETGQVRPVGSSEVRKVRVRLVAASNRDLAAEVKAGRFRADLFYRLNSFTIDIPPLRERRPDILPLAHHFLQRFNVALGRSATGFAPEAAELLQRCDWPGNVRELRNAVERAVLLCAPGQAITPAELPSSLSASAPPTVGATLRERLEDAERQILAAALEAAGGVIRRAARELGADPVTLARRARKLGLLGPGSGGS